MRRSLGVAVCAVVAGACAALAGLDDPAPVPRDAAVDAPPNDDADATAPPPPDAALDAGVECPGTIVHQDAFDDRPDARGAWRDESNFDGGLLAIEGGRLHVRVPAADAGVTVHRQLFVARPRARKVCAAFTVHHAKPQTTTGYAQLGDTTFGFVSASGDAGTFYHGIQVAPPGLYVYARRGGANDEVRLTTAELGAKWRVVIRADYEADNVFIGVNGEGQTFPFIRPGATPDVVFHLGVRNSGIAPEAEAHFDDVVVTAD